MLWRLRPFFGILLLLSGTSLAQEPEATRQVSLTFDDLPLSGPAQSLFQIREMTDEILGALRRFGAPAIGLVNEVKLQVEGESEERIRLLAKWLEAGAQLGNHTFSHPNLNQVEAEAFIADIRRGETVTRKLLQDRGEQLRYFRHPYLRTGQTREKRNKVEGFLAEQGYRIAPVTLENSDWIFNVAWLEAQRKGDEELGRRVVQAYLDFTDQMFDFFEEAAATVAGRQIKQVLLLHANPINARALPGLLAHLRERGYTFISLDDALQDPVYSRPDDYLGPAGVNWVFRWDIGDGERDVDWRREPQPPSFVTQLYNDRP